LRKPSLSWSETTCTLQVASLQVECEESSVELLNSILTKARLRMPCGKSCKLTKARKTSSIAELVEATTL